MIGRTSVDLGVWEDPEDRERIIREIKATGSVTNVEVRRRTKSGERTIMLFSGEALRIYRDRREEIDLVILDLIIPDMAGGETYDHLKRINPGVKVLLSSGYSINGRAREMLDRGCDGFIQKPFDLAELSGRVRSILDGK